MEIPGAAMVTSLLEEYFSSYMAFRRSEKGRAWAEEREDKKRILSNTFSKEMLRKASDEEFVKALRIALSSLWAIAAVWTKVEHHVSQIIEKNGVDKLRALFYDLIYGERPLEDRLDNFLASAWGLGVAAATEILCFVRPEKYAMWNRRVAQAIEKLGLLEDLLKILGLRGKQPANILSISGHQYVKIISFLDGLRRELERLSNQKTDFLELDFFLYYIAEEAPTVTREAIMSHEEAQYYLLKLGQLLGYATYVARQDKNKVVNNEKLGEIADIGELPQWLILYGGIRSPEDIDVLWLNSTGERPVYAFEVSHSTDIAKDAAALQDLALIARKVFIVAPDEKGKEFEKLKLSTQFKSLIQHGKLGFIPYSELLDMYSNAKRLRELLDRVGIQIQGF